MKSPATVGFLLFLAVTGSATQTATGGSTTLYHNAAMGVSYVYPADFESQPEMATALEKAFVAASASDPDRASQARCATFPLVAIKGTGAPQTGDFGMIVMARIDYGCAGEVNGEQYLGEDAQRLMQILARFGVPVTDDALKYKLDTHPTAFVKGSAPAKLLGDGRMMHAASVCTLLGPSTLCWIILDTNHKAMPALVASPVTFDGGTAAPLVPKDMVEAW